jgi:hypothetical protein
VTVTTQARARVLELAGLPRAAKLGISVIVLGLAVDSIVHAMGVVTAGTPAAFVVQQHLAHLTVLVGMVATLAGIVADGVRVDRRPPGRQKEASDAVR